MKKFHVFSALLALAAFAMLAGPAFAEFTPVGALLFQDTYNYTGIADDLNVDINSPSRVAGPLAGQVSYDTANMVGLKDIDGPNLKMDLSQGGSMDSRACVGLTKDFNDDLALGGLTVCATVNPRGGVVTIGVGHNGSSACRHRRYVSRRRQLLRCIPASMPMCLTASRSPQPRDDRVWRGRHGRSGSAISTLLVVFSATATSIWQWCSPTPTTIIPSMVRAPSLPKCM